MAGKNSHRFEVLTALVDEGTVQGIELADELGVEPETVYSAARYLREVGIPVQEIGGGGPLGVVEGLELSPAFVRIGAGRNLLLSQARQLYKLERPAAETAQVLFGRLGAQVPTAPKMQTKPAHGRGRSTPGTATTSRLRGGPHSDGMLELMETAIEEGEAVRMEYRNGQGVTTERIISPDEIIGASGDWYVDAYCYLRQEDRTFRGSRIRWAEIMDPDELADMDMTISMMDEPQEPPDFLTRFALPYREPVFSDRPAPQLPPANWPEPVSVHLLVGLDHAERVYGTFGRDDIVGVRGDRFEIMGKLPADGLLESVLSLGADVRVLEPASLREQIVRAARKLLGNNA